MDFISMRKADFSGNQRSNHIKARLCLLEDVAFLVRSGAHVPGTLTAIPVPVQRGVLKSIRMICGRMASAFHGLRTTILTLLLMALLPSKLHEGFKEPAPGYSGGMLGLAERVDCVPDYETIRRKAAVLGVVHTQHKAFIDGRGIVYTLADRDDLLLEEKLRRRQATPYFTNNRQTPLLTSRRDLLAVAVARYGRYGHDALVDDEVEQFTHLQSAYGREALQNIKRTQPILRRLKIEENKPGRAIEATRKGRHRSSGGGLDCVPQWLRGPPRQTNALGIILAVIPSLRAKQNPNATQFRRLDINDCVKRNNHTQGARSWRK